MHLCLQKIIELINLVYPSALRDLEKLDVMRRIELLGPVTKVKKNGEWVPFYSDEEKAEINSIITDMTRTIRQLTGRQVGYEAMWTAIEKMRMHRHWDYKFETVNMSLARDVWSADHLGFGYLIFNAAFDEPDVAYQKLLGPKRLGKVFPHRFVLAPRLEDYPVRKGGEGTEQR